MGRSDHLGGAADHKGMDGGESPVGGQLDGSDKIGSRLEQESGAKGGLTSVHRLHGFEVEARDDQAIGMSEVGEFRENLRHQRSGWVMARLAGAVLDLNIHLHTCAGFDDL